MAFARKEARAAPAAEERIGGFTVEQLQNVIEDVFRSATHADHPSQAATAPAAADDSLQIWQVLQILHGGRPAPGTRRQLYDAAIRQVREAGEGNNQAEAISYFNRALIGSLTRLQELATSLDDIPEDRRTPLDEMLAEIQLNSRIRGDAGAHYVEFRGSRELLNDMLDLIADTAGESMVTEVTDEERGLASAESPETYAWDQALAEQGYVHWMTGNTSDLILGDPVGGEGAYVFGGDTGRAQDAADAMANLFRADARGEANSSGCQQLYNALEHMTNEALQDHPRWTGLMDALEANDRAAAIDHLRALAAGTPLTDIIDAASKMTVVQIRQRAVSIFRAGLEVVLDRREALNDFEEHRTSGSTGRFGFRYLQTVLSAYYDLLGTSGQRIEGSYDIYSGEFTPSDQPPERLEGLGSAITIGAQAIIGTSGFRGDPLQIVVHLAGGWRQRDLGGPITMEAVNETTGEVETRTLTMDPNDFNLGYWGIEIRRPGRPGREAYRGERWFRLERFGLSGVGIQAEEVAEGQWEYRPNLLGYLTFSTTVDTGTAGSDRIRASAFRSTYTAHVAYLLDHLRAGGELDAEFAMRFRNDMIVGVGGNVRAMHNIGTEVTTIEGTGRVRWQVTPGVELTFRGGALADAGGREADRIPTLPITGLTLRLTPRLIHDHRLGEQLEEPVDVSAAVPTRAVFEVNQQVRDLFIEAERYLLETDRDAAEERRLATELAQAIRNQVVQQTVSDDPAVGALTGSTHYRTGIEHLSAGRLSEGMTSLLRLASFRVIRESTLRGELVGILRAEQAYIAAHDEVNAEEEGERARALAAAIRANASDLADLSPASAGELTDYPEYPAALQQLDSGNLRQGMETFLSIPFIGRLVGGPRVEPEEEPPEQTGAEEEPPPGATRSMAPAPAPGTVTVPRTLAGIRDSLISLFQAERAYIAANPTADADADRARATTFAANIRAHVSALATRAPGPARQITSNPAYNAAMGQLDAGNLREAITTFLTIPEVRNLFGS